MLSPLPTGQARTRVVLTLPDLAVGGGQIIVRNYLRARDREHFDVGIVTLRPEPADLLAEFAALGARPLCLHQRSTSAPDRLRAIRRLATVLRRVEADVVHVHGPDDRKIGIAAAALTGVPVLCHLHSEWRHLGVHVEAGASPLAKARGQVAAAVRDALERHTVAAYLADSRPVAEAFEPYVARPILSMDQTFDTDEFDAAAGSSSGVRAELGIPPDAPVILNVSRLATGKGHDRLLRAFADAHRDVPTAVLVVAGSGELDDDLRALARTLGVADAVFLLGQRRDVPALLRDADVFAFTSETESFGLVVGEAMAARLPVVAYRLPAVDDYTRTGVTGYFLDQGDEAGFVDALVRLLREPTLRERMGEAGRAVVETRFHRRATADSFEAAYRRVLAERLDQPLTSPVPLAGGERLTHAAHPAPAP